jgi:uncharacterized protein with HEPN domain
MRREDAVRLRHVVDACASIQRFVAGRGRNDLEADEMLRFALARAIEIVGEAAARVTEETRREMPHVPWALIVGMRNRLVHAYFAVDHDVLWRTATEEIPQLAARLTDRIPNG